MKVAAVIVTYNRKDLLVRAIESVINQRRSADAVFIIDNHSTDGTPELLIENGYLEKLPEVAEKDWAISKTIGKDNVPVKITYVRKFENDGGAGGFYAGMKIAHEQGYDWLWFMDDDGVADENQLQSMLQKSEKFGLDYINALVLYENDPNELAFGLKNYTHKSDIKEKDVIFGSVNPFNGTLISKKVIDRIGYIKKEMFIWGDETEYMLRTQKAGFEVATDVEAYHYHPKGKVIMRKIIPFTNRWKIIEKPSFFRKIYFKNLGFNTWKYQSLPTFVIIMLKYTMFYTFRLNGVQLLRFYSNYIKGAMNKY